MDTEEFDDDFQDDGEKLYQLDTDTLMGILESATSQKKAGKKGKNKKNKKQK